MPASDGSWNDQQLEALLSIHSIVQDLPYAALHWRAIEGNEHGLKYVWEVIATSQEEAIEFYQSLEFDERVKLAAEALLFAGWTKAKVCYRNS